MGSESERLKGAFVVLLSSESYTVGVLVLAWSLKSVKTQYPLVVLHTEEGLSGESLRALERAGCLLREVERIVPLQEDSSHVQSYYADTWTKLQVFGLTDFERVVMLDADMLVRRNLDELMTLKLPGNDWIAASSGCLCNPLKIPTYPSHW
jgi:alpha-N-acetylglucosamine transferase